MLEMNLFKSGLFSMTQFVRPARSVHVEGKVIFHGNGPY